MCMMSFAGLLFSATQIRIVIEEEDGQLLPYTAIIKNEKCAVFLLGVSIISGDYISDLVVDMILCHRIGNMKSLECMINKA